MSVVAKSHEVLTTAQHFYHKNPNWVVFFREILGGKGIVRRLYSTNEALAEFEKTPEYAEIQAMLSKLRSEGNGEAAAQEEPCKVITVRMPQSMHESLKEEAHAYRTSMNQLCISKLLQIVDGDLVPTDNKGKTVKAE